MRRAEFVEQESIDSYIENLNFQCSDFLKKLSEFANINNVPIIKNDVANYLKTHLMIQKPNSILELGTAIGYSSLLFYETLNENCNITTLEINDDMFNIAYENFKKRNALNNISIIKGNAIDSLKELQGKELFDFAFIDAAKGQYKEFLTLILPLMKENGVIICDNILYQGMVAMDLDKVPRRKRTIVRNMKGFIEELMSHKNLTSTIIPVGDGLSISYLKNK